MRHCTPLCPQVFHLSQAKQDVAAGVLVCHQHRCQQRLYPVQNVRCLSREEVQPGSIWGETCQGVAGPGGCITSPLRLCWPRGGRDKEGACHLPACWRAHVWPEALLSASPPEREWAPQSPVRVTGGAVAAEATSSRTGGPCSAAQSLRDHDSSSSDQASLQNGPLSATTQHLGTCVISLDGTLQRRHAVWCH